MGAKVTHFEVVGKDGPALLEFYGQLFGWKIDADNSFGYGLVDAGEAGIGGGIGPTRTARPDMSPSTCRRTTRQRLSSGSKSSAGGWSCPSPKWCPAPRSRSSPTPRVTWSG